MDATSTTTITTTGAWGKPAGDLLSAPLNELYNLNFLSWYELSLSEFEAFVRLCAGFKPVRLIAVWGQVAARLVDAPELAVRLLEETAAGVTTISPSESPLIRSAPLVARQAVTLGLRQLDIPKDLPDALDQIRPVIEIVLEVAYSLESTAARQYYGQMMEVFSTLDPVQFYRVLTNQISEHGLTKDRAQLSLWMLEQAEMWLGTRGFIVGALVQTTDRGRLHVPVGKGPDQLLFYSRRRGSGGHTPVKGDVVAFQPGKGKPAGGHWVEVSFRRVRGS